MKYRENLLEKIQKLISSEWDIQTFEKEYYDFYLDYVPYESLTENEHDFFGLVQEKLDWVAKNPPKEDRKYGWHDYEEYKNWLKRNMTDFLADENKWVKSYLDNFKW